MPCKSPSNEQLLHSWGGGGGGEEGGGEGETIKS